MVLILERPTFFWEPTIHNVNLEIFIFFVKREETCINPTKGKNCNSFDN